jgi:ribosomal protein L25 (general stress protein Ctc)
MSQPDASGNPMAEIMKIASAMGMPKTGGARNTRKAGKVPAVGTKAQVWHNTARHTSGGLGKSDLMKTKKGRIVSKKKHAAGKRALSRLRKAGFVAKKGTFKLFTR